MMQAPRRRESGRPPTAQFAARPGVYTRWKCGKVREGGDARVVTADLIARARAGDGDAFRELTEPYLRELQVHCYRMLGSFQDAEDALQNTLLTAWQGLGGFEGRASLRTSASADLLVMARDGDRSRLGPKSLGKAARFVVDHAACPVLLVWPESAPDVTTIPPPPHHPSLPGQ
jgi:hypothetical protein